MQRHRRYAGLPSAFFRVEANTAELTYLVLKLRLLLPPATAFANSIRDERYPTELIGRRIDLAKLPNCATPG
jgi:hypothetical protein